LDPIVALTEELRWSLDRHRSEVYDDHDAKTMNIVRSRGAETNMEWEREHREMQKRSRHAGRRRHG
jgi:hypothetical protein